MKINLLVWTLLIMLSCSKNHDCPEIRIKGHSTMSTNHHPWSNAGLGSLNFYKTRENGELITHHDLRVIGLSNFYPEICSVRALMFLESLPLIEKDTIYPTMGTFYPFDYDVAAEVYGLTKIRGFKNWLYIDDMNKDGTKMKGTFEAAFVYDTSGLPKYLDPLSPDTLYFTNGYFEVEFVD